MLCVHHTTILQFPVLFEATYVGCECDWSSPSHDNCMLLIFCVQGKWAVSFQSVLKTWWRMSLAATTNISDRTARESEQPASQWDCMHVCSKVNSGNVWLYCTSGMCVCLCQSYAGDGEFAVTGSVVDDVCLILFRMLSWKTVFIVSLRLVWEKVLKCCTELLHLNLLFTFVMYRRNNGHHFFFLFS